MKFGKTKEEKWVRILAEAKEASKWKPYYALFPEKLVDGRIVWLEWIEEREIYCIYDKYSENLYLPSFNTYEYRLPVKEEV